MIVVAVLGLVLGLLVVSLIVLLAVWATRDDRKSARAGVERAETVPLLPWPREWPAELSLPRAVVQVPTLRERFHALTHSRGDVNASEDELDGVA